jgi:hypothetical protein
MDTNKKIARKADFRLRKACGATGSSVVPYAHTMADRSPHLPSGSRRTASVRDAKLGSER